MGKWLYLYRALAFAKVWRGGNSVEKCKFGGKTKTVRNTNILRFTSRVWLGNGPFVFFILLSSKIAAVTIKSSNFDPTSEHMFFDFKSLEFENSMDEFVSK